MNHKQNHIKFSNPISVWKSHTRLLKNPTAPGKFYEAILKDLAIFLYDLEKKMIKRKYLHPHSINKL